MLKLLEKIPKKVTVCCSGGPDSMAALHFLISGKRDVSVLHFDHNTNHSKKGRVLVEGFCLRHRIPISVHEILESPPPGESVEAWWRDKRYEIINRLDHTVVTGHNLDDAAEWWIFTALRGNPRLMPYKTENVIKPFLLTKKSDLEGWCKKNKIPYVIDPTNNGTRFARSRIRNNIMPEALNVCPGFLGTISKKIKDRNNKEKKAAASALRESFKIIK